MENLLFLGVPILKHIRVDPSQKTDLDFWDCFRGKPHVKAELHVTDFGIWGHSGVEKFCLITQ